MTTDRLLNEAMLMLASRPSTVFIGQNVLYDGASIYKSLAGVPTAQRIEWPVAEELNVGAAIGLSLMGFLPVVQIPRMDFLLRAADQIVLHLDKMEAMTAGQFRPAVILRTKVGSKVPLDAGLQHTNDLTAGFQAMLRNVYVVKITQPEQILPVYRAAERAATDEQRSTLVVEAL